MTNDFVFHNISQKNMCFQDVFAHIQQFIKRNNKGTYRLMIGTDSQVHPRSTRFITGIVIRNVGHGAWGCLTKHEQPRRIESLHEKISIETDLTEEVASLFTVDRKKQLYDLILPYVKEGSSLMIEGHIDIGMGERNKTKIYVDEMMNRIEVLGMKPLIKPDSIVASSYANRFTK